MGIGSWLGLWFGLSISDFGDVFAEAQIFGYDCAKPFAVAAGDKKPGGQWPWQKLQNRLLLWLQLLAAALLVFALMKPYWSAADIGKAHVVLVADTSGSMSARSGSAQGQPGEEKLALMKRMIKDYLEHEAKDGEITLLGMNVEPNLLISREKTAAAPCRPSIRWNPILEGPLTMKRCPSLPRSPGMKRMPKSSCLPTGSGEGSRTRCRLGFR